MDYLLRKERCAQFVSSVLKELGVKGTIKDIFNAVKNQPLATGGFGSYPQSKYAAEAIGSVDGGDPGVDINYRIYIGNNSYLNAADGRTLIHELIHNAGHGISHYQMAMASYDVGTAMKLDVGSPPTKPDPKDFEDYRNGTASTSIMFQVCKP
jgi:hypothetical protein